MTKPQAIALTDALDARNVPYQMVMTLNGTGVASWSVQLDRTHVYSGADLSALAQYCANKNLVLSALFDQLGVM